VTARSLPQLSSSWLIFLFTSLGRSPIVVVFNLTNQRQRLSRSATVLPIRPQDQTTTNKEATYVFYSPIMSYILSILICIWMIFLDNLVQCLLFVDMIDMSRSCDSSTDLIYYASIMFMIYSWIKIKLKMLIFPTIQKPYYSHFGFMAGFVDALKTTPFTGTNFKR
jgi:hypothetical protein